MKISILSDIIKKFINHENKWAVFLHFDYNLYFQVHPKSTTADAIKYLKSKFVNQNDITTRLWTNKFMVIHFDSEIEAQEFFKQIPDGSLVGAEIYNPQGVFEDDNT